MYCMKRVIILIYLFVYFVSCSFAFLCFACFALPFFLKRKKKKKTQQKKKKEFGSADMEKFFSLVGEVREA